jgi:hypothetical protein
MFRQTLGSLVGVVLLVGLAAQPAAATTYPITFDYVPIGRAFITGTATPNATVSLVWKDANGAVKLQQTFSVNEYGDWDYFEPDSSSPVVAIGDRLRASDGSSTHTLVIPELTMNINRVNGVMKGRGPAGEYVKLQCGGSPFKTFEPCIWQKKLRVGEDGRWVYRNFSNDGLIGGSTMYVRWRSDAGDKVLVEATSPFVAITLGSSRFSGAGHAYDQVQITIADATTLDVKATGTALAHAAGGAFSGRFLDDQGERVAISAGDRMTANIASDADWIVPEVEGHANPSTDTVSGRCFDAGTALPFARVLLFRAGHERGDAWPNVAADGSFAFDFTDGGFYVDPAVIKSGDRLVIMCMQAGGDWVQRVIFAGA